MVIKPDDALDPIQPALIVTYGNTPRKHRPLTRPVTVLGKARGCDIGLAAPDVSNVHCVIVRIADKFYVRDCASRAGTRLNGDPVDEALLHDGDILQIGPFSFQVYLPPAHPAPLPPPDAAERLQRLERARRNLVRLALAKRKRLRGLAAIRKGAATEQALANRQAEIDRQAATLRDQERELEQRARQLEKAIRDLACDRETLDKEFAALQDRVQKVEQELAQRRAEAEAEIQARWEQFQEQARHLEPQQPEPISASPLADEKSRSLEIRERELESLGKHLLKTQQCLREQEERFQQARQQLALDSQKMQRDQKARSQEWEKWNRETAEAAQRLTQQREGILQAETALRQQREELVRMMTELKQVHEAARRQENADLAALRRENALLRQQVADLEQHSSNASGATPCEDNLTAELEQLRARLGQLGQLVSEKDALIEQLRQPQAVPIPVPPAESLDSFEAELNRFRHQLENEKLALQDEVRNFHARRGELDTATREMELEISRERAELARERVRLDRLREEIHLELEKAQRDVDMRQRLAPVQRIKGGQADRQENASV
ncbi:MAG: hypothetical protein C5B56_02870 [Proteobacteria bacterium]|nr:MAG: hypothetical protein C5B56_02870 [Pseudomonadota bacterium]